VLEVQEGGGQGRRREKAGRGWVAQAFCRRIGCESGQTGFQDARVSYLSRFFFLSVFLLQHVSIRGDVPPSLAGAKNAEEGRAQESHHERREEGKKEERVEKYAGHISQQVTRVATRHGYAGPWY